LTNAEIAVQLRLSPETVKWHVSELLSLTGRQSREELAAWWQTRRQSRRSGWPWLRIALAGAATCLVAGAVYIGAGGDASQNLEPLSPAAFAVGVPGLPTPRPSATPLSEADLNTCPTDFQAQGSLAAGFRLVETGELTAEGLTSTGQQIEASTCGVLASGRVDRAYFRVPLSAKILGLGLLPYSLDRIWSTRYEIKLFGRVISLSVLSTNYPYSDFGYRGPGAELVVMARDEVGRRHRMAVDADGRIWIDPDALADDTAVDEWTGQSVDTTAMTRLERLLPAGRPQQWAKPTFYFTSCDDSGCHVSYRPFQPTLAPVDGTLSCLPPGELPHDAAGRPVGVMELDAGAFKLRFTELYTSTPNGRTAFACEPRQVKAGDRIGDHYHYLVEAFAADGSPISVVVSEDSTLFVGTTEFQVRCPCLSGS